MANKDKTQQNPNNPTVSFVFYLDYKKYLGYLNGDEIKSLMNLIFDFVENYDFENPKNPVGFDEATPITQMVFEVITGQIKRDKAKYEQKAAANRENGRLGGRPKKNPQNPNNPTVVFKNPTKPKKSHNVQCTMINDIEEEEKIIPPQEIITNNPCACARWTEDYPTLEEVESFVAFRSSPVDAKKFYETYANATPPWTDKSGVPIRDWRKVLVAWEGQHRTVYVADENKGLPLGSVSEVL